MPSKAGPLPLTPEQQDTLTILNLANPVEFYVGFGFTFGVGEQSAFDTGIYDNLYHLIDIRPAPGCHLNMARVFRLTDNGLALRDKLNAQKRAFEAWLHAA